MKKLIATLVIILPWRLRRLALVHLFGFVIHPSAKIGFSFILPDHLEMAEGSQIGHLNVCRGISLLKMGAYSSIGNLNWITGFPFGDARHFDRDGNRRPELQIGTHAALTNRHYIDCTNSVHLGDFATFAGCSSQILTHSIDLEACRQSSKPIEIGVFCFVGTGSILLGGSVLPSYSVLAAGSVLNKPFTGTHTLYAGTPARPVKQLSADLAYFRRKRGYVD